MKSKHIRLAFYLTVFQKKSTLLPFVLDLCEKDCNIYTYTFISITAYKSVDHLSQKYMLKS